MQKVIDEAVKTLIKIIDSKPNSEKVAWQFILEELDAGQKGHLFVIQRLCSLNIDRHKFNGAMNRSWHDVDGLDGPQQYLLMLTIALAEKTNNEIAANVRISIVEYIASHYKFGKYNSTSYEKYENKIDLFKILANDNKLHPHFTNLMKDAQKPIREVLNIWVDGFEDRDNKFSKQFQETFNSMFWELYLHQSFKELNMNIDFSKASPDFTVSTSYGNDMCIEAVISNNGDKDEPEWSDVGHSEFSNKSRIEFLNYSSIRLLNAITTKHKKYQDDYVELSHVKNKPYIIAVAPYEQSMFFIQNNEAINMVLYAQGLSHNLESKDKETVFKEIGIPYVEKENGTKLDLGIFTTDKYKEISAIIFSTTATYSKAKVQSNMDCTVRSSRYHRQDGLIVNFTENKDYMETHLDGLQIHHNPFAEIPLDPKEFDRYEITHYRYNCGTKEIDVEQNDYTLISRNLM